MNNQKGNAPTLPMGRGPGGRPGGPMGARVNKEKPKNIKYSKKYKLQKSVIF